MKSGDFAGLRALAEPCGDHFAFGVVLYPAACRSHCPTRRRIVTFLVASATPFWSALRSAGFRICETERANCISSDEYREFGLWHAEVPPGAAAGPSHEPRRP